MRFFHLPAIGAIIVMFALSSMPTHAVAPGGATGISKYRGFDKCAAATVSQMQTWWTNSPYWDANIYIGGSSRACSQTNLTSSWVSSINSQGWGIIPTWVGPQAPCSGFSSRMSYDTATARSQGINQASSAHSAAVNLGFAAGTIIYYDIEAYDTSNTSCKAAVKAFLGGWDYQLHVKGDYAGIYGSSCGSNVAGWASLSTVPDDVWVAAWDGRHTVWGLSCLSDTLWSNNQRIHQYQGGHNETYGGITFNIDGDCEDGRVAAHGHAPASGICP